MIRNIQMKHAGKYTCAVQTKVDSSSVATDLIVRGTIQTVDILLYHRTNSAPADSLVLLLL